MSYLFNPGPVNLSKRVREALLGADICHRESEFLELHEEIQRRLLDVYALDPRHWQILIHAGSGTSAVESMLVSLVPEGGRVLVLHNGAYGERMQAILECHGISHCSLGFPWDEAIELGRLEEALKAEPALSHVALVQNETSSGRLNDIGGVAALCRERGLPLLVDAVSAFGAEDLCTEAGNVAAYAFSSGKCLHGIPGLGLVLLSREAAESLGKPRKNQNFYLDLQRYLKAFHSRSGPPFTPSVHCCYALREALAELQEAGGWKARRALYLHRRRLLHKGLEIAGFSPLVLAPQASSSISIFLLRGMSYAALHDTLKQEGMIIYAAQGRFAEGSFLLSIMGDLPDAVVQRLASRIGELYAGGH